VDHHRRPRLLIFGKRLPGAARGIGQSIVEFKKGLKATESDADAAATSRPSRWPTRPPARSGSTRTTGKPLSPDQTATA
jgi:Sec-independent protein translocase protein TatA